VPPVSLVVNARLEGTCYTLGESRIPAGLRYTFPPIQSAGDSARSREPRRL